MIDKYRKGKRTYTHWDKKSEQVTVSGSGKKAPEQPQLRVEVSPSLENGTNANLFIVHHNSDEFVLDCGFAAPGSPKAKISARVVMSPGTAKKFCSALQRAVEEK